MAAITSAANGNWSATGTWTGGVVPGAGDTATVNHNVTVTANTTIGDGTTATVLDVTNGTLTITGATLTVRGQSVVGKYNGGSLVTRLTIQNSGATPGGIEFDGNSTVAPVMTTDYDTAIVITGTSSARCFVRTKSGTAGNPGRIVNAVGHARLGYMTAAYCDFARLGDATNHGIEAINLNGADISPGTPAFSFDHCTVDSCGITPYIVVADGVAIVSLTNSTWDNALDSNFYSLTINSNIALSTGTRLVDSCQFLGAGKWPFFNGGRGFTITNNYFHDGVYSIHSQPNWATFDGNFIRAFTNRESTVTGDMTNCFMLMDAVTPSFQWLHCASSSSAISRNVFQATGSVSSGDIIANTEHPTADYTYTISYNIVLPSSGDGGMSGPIAGATSNDTDPGSGYGKGNGVFEHNTQFVGVGPGVGAGSGVGQVAGTILSFRANILWNTGTPASTAYALINLDSTKVTDIVSAANCDYNAWTNLKTVPAGTNSGVSGDTGHEDGTVYNVPLSGSTAPGVHDKANTSPNFVDATRTFQSWDASLGGAGTVVAALARIRANLALTKTSLLPYIRAGYRPRNAALQAASYPGDTSTADADGNAWPGGSPGIGAMAVQVSSGNVGGPGMMLGF